MAPRLSFNEGKACDAVIQRIETREGAARRNLRSPERERHPAPVELVCEIGARLFAFEHTGIEPFVGHMQLEAEAMTHFKPIEAMVAGKLPPNEHLSCMCLSRPSRGFGAPQCGVYIKRSHRG
jgi:hypothetical protein